MSSIDPELTRSLAADAADTGFRWLDCSLSGLYAEIHRLLVAAGIVGAGSAGFMKFYEGPEPVDALYSSVRLNLEDRSGRWGFLCHAGAGFHPLSTSGFAVGRN